MITKDMLIKGAECVDYSHEGLGVIKYEGMAIFVPNLLKGEIADVQVTKAEKRFGFGKIVDLIKTSPERVEVTIEETDESGILQLQHMSYDEQLRFKQQITQAAVNKTLADGAPTVLPTIGSPKQWHYRNKMQVPVRHSALTDSIIAGFYQASSHEIVPIESSAIHDEKSLEMLHAFIDLANQSQITAYDQKKKVGNFRHLVIQKAEATGEYMLVFVTFGKERKALQRIAEAMVQQFPEIVSIVENVNTQHNSKILGETRRAFYGNTYMTDKIMDDVKLRVHAESFYQVNYEQMQQLYKTALDLADVQANDVVVDFYSGIGTLSILFAKHAKFVYGVEVNAKAVISAEINAEENDLINTEFICSDVDTVMEDWAEKKLPVDIVLLDPPRKGCSPEFLKDLAALDPKKIVYISCNPSSFARDLKLLAELGYTTNEIQPVDLFPQTFHTENVALLVKK